MMNFGNLIKPLNWSLALLAIALVSGCGGSDGGSTDTTAPTVSATAPADGATNVSLNSSVSATFSEAMDPATITTTTFTLMQGLSVIPGAVSYVGTTATFNPTSNLTASTVYTATVTTGAKDLAGRALAQAMVWSFTTGTTTDTTAPTVTLTYPVDAANNVAINTSVSATFSETMDAATITTTSFTLTQGATAVPGTVTYVGKIATFTPTTNLLPSLLYTATVTAAAMDLAGNALTPEVWTFTTGTTTDTTAPVVSSTAPLDNATGVAINSNVRATFSEVMDAATISTATFGLKQGTTVIPGTVTYIGNTATFNPLSDLTANLVYTATVTTGVEDMAGNALASAKIWSFTAGAIAAGPPPVDLLTAGDFVILANTAVTYNGTAAVPAVTGDVGISPAFSASITGFSGYAVDISTNDFATAAEIVIPGKIYAPDFTGGALNSNGLTPAKMTAAQNDMVTAYNDAAGRTPGVGATNLNLGAGTLTALTPPLVPGTYTWDAGTPGGNVNITGDITLTGNATDVWIFQISGALTQASATNIILGGTAQAKNIFWQVAGGITINTTAHMEGVLMSATAITMNAGATANSRLLAQSAVTLGGTVTQPAP